MARRSFLSQLVALPLFGMAAQSQSSGRKKLNIMMISAWGSDDPTKAAFPFLHGLALAEAGHSVQIFLLGEAAHSGLDLVAGAITFVAVRISGRPADSTHLYGHGKVENLSALAETLLLLGTCAWIASEAMHRLLYHRVQVEVTAWSFVVM